MAGENTSLRAAGWVNLCSLGQLILQFVFQMFLARQFGASWEMDAYVAAIAVPTVVSAVFVGSLGYAFVPLFGRLLKQDPDRAWTLAGTMAMLLVLVTTCTAMMAHFGAQPLVRLLFPGFNEERFALAVVLLRIHCWLIVTNGMIAFLQSLYHCHKRFLVPALAAPIGIALTVLGAIAFREHGMPAIAWAVLAGSATAVVLQLPLLVRHARYSIARNRDVTQCLLLITPMVLGALYFRLDPLVDRYLTSLLSVGSVAHLGYAWRMSSAVLMITVGGLSVVAFPSFAEHWSAGRQTEFRTEVASAVRCLIAILVPIGFALTFYSEPLIANLFQRGEFTAADSRAVGRLLTLYVGMIVGAGIGEITSKVFYSLSDTRTPTLLGVGSFSVGLVLKIVFVKPFGAAAIVAATSFYFVLSALFAVVLIVRRFGPELFAGAGAALGRAVLASTTATLAAWPVVNAGFPFAVFPAAALGGIVYFLAMFAQRDEFAKRMMQYLLSTCRSKHARNRT